MVREGVILREKSGFDDLRSRALVGKAVHACHGTVSFSYCCHSHCCRTFFAPMSHRIAGIRTFSGRLKHVQQTIGGGFSVFTLPLIVMPPNLQNHLPLASKGYLRGAWSDRDTNDIFAHCSFIFYYLDFKFSNFVCPSELHHFIWFFLKKSFRRKKKYPKNLPKRLSS